jgi:hypothetical protein
MRNKPYYQQEPHTEVKRARFLQGMDKRMAKTFANVAKLELYKAKARSLLASLPKEDGYSLIPNEFLESLMKEDFEAEQFNEVLRIFRSGSGS